uniref:Uncharacterized protein n=1 Tax=Anguilla anguilla TaxID=7936 RepID=A0A0E9U8Z6_ANGAN
MKSFQGREGKDRGASSLWGAC